EIDPPQRGISGGIASRNRPVEVLSAGEFVIRGDGPILVSQFLIGSRSRSEGNTGRGDPSLSIVAPAAQWRSDYQFVAPTSYRPETNGQSYVLITRARGAAIALDGQPIDPEWRSTGSYEIGILAVDGGTHRLQSDGSPFAAMAYGLGSFTSY